MTSNDPVVLGLILKLMADPAHPDPRLADPVFLDALVQKILAVKAMLPTGMTVQDFLTIVQTAGVALNPLVVQRATATGAAQSFLGDKSDTFRIVAVGQAGDVERKVTAVIRLKDPQQDGLGRVMYWRAD